MNVHSAPVNAHFRRLPAPNCRADEQCPDSKTGNGIASIARCVERDQIEVQATGANPQKATSSFRDGQTRFDYGGNTYFVYRSPDRAQRELANFHD